ncbi:MAG: HAD-IG family 5'-nucleotidase [Zetaproteobacteria bacterium]|nr:HAD-IG family 5'-nucleotidase [Zetaproteobacteria bacterium]
MPKNAPHRGIPDHKRIFVNRSVSLGKVKLFGFDMDYTLAPYDRLAFETLAFSETLKKFIAAGYPEELKNLSYKHDFVIRGLLVDRDRGNILKVDSHKYVKDAYHGYQRLSKEERHKLYNRQSYKAQEFLSLDTLFALSEVQLFAEIVDYMSKNPGKIHKSFREIYTDVRTYIDMCHQDGSIKNKVLADPEKYINRDKHLPLALAHLKDAGRQLFLLTNSNYPYTNAVMEYILEGGAECYTKWKDFMDYIIVGAGKPGFFTGSQPFFEVVENTEGLLKLHQGSLKKRCAYFGGNAKEFERLTGHQGDEILYVGDHIYGDIIQSKDSLNWRTMLILKELEEQITCEQRTDPYVIRIKENLHTKEELDQKMQETRSLITSNARQASMAQQEGDTKRLATIQKALTKQQSKLEEYKELLNQLEQEIQQIVNERANCFHPQWGELMKVGMERSRFADQVSSYACLYSSRVSNLRFYSPYKKFVSAYEAMPHEYRLRNK